jgi:hypothetical protein
MSRSAFIGRSEALGAVRLSQIALPAPLRQCLASSLLAVTQTSPGSPRQALPSLVVHPV